MAVAGFADDRGLQGVRDVCLRFDPLHQGRSGHPQQTVHANDRKAAVTRPCVGRGSSNHQDLGCRFDGEQLGLHLDLRSAVDDSPLRLDGVGRAVTSLCYTLAMSSVERSRYLWDAAGLEIGAVPTGVMPWDRPPRVRRDGDTLHWQYVVLGDDDDPHEQFPVGFGPLSIRELPRSITTGSRLLRAFLDLAGRPWASYERFAGRWGVLHLCAHGLPRTHPPFPDAPVAYSRRIPGICETVEPSDLQGSEDLKAWLFWSARGRAVLDIASSLREGVTDAHLADQWAFISPHAPKAASRDPDWGRVQMGREIEQWLRLAGVVPRVDLATPPHVRLSGSDLFGTIALQLVIAATGASNLSFCSYCGDSYLPTRKPHQGQRTFCDGCRRKGRPVTLAKLDMRARRRASRR